MPVNGIVFVGFITSFLFSITELSVFGVNLSHKIPEIGIIPDREIGVAPAGRERTTSVSVPEFGNVSGILRTGVVVFLICCVMALPKALHGTCFK